MTEGPHGLLVDYGGVLTGSLGRSFRAFEEAEGLDKGAIFRVIRDAYAVDAHDNPIARYERGETDTATFERELGTFLREAGLEVEHEGMAARMFAGMRPEGGMWEVVERARGAGVRTALLSNSWGTEGYPMARLREVFDDLVISGEVGLRKPDPRMFHLAADRLGVPVRRCAFVDDLDRNVEAAEALGMFGVHHTGDVAATARALSGFLGTPLL